MLSLALVAAACTNAADRPATEPPPMTAAVVSIANEGGSMEGHTPTGFTGMGTGLFVGDNLNPSFPEGQGVQAYLTFSLPAAVLISRALIASDALAVVGTPFDDLGVLLIEPVEYRAFGPELFDLDASGDPVACHVTGSSAIECGVTTAVQSAIDNGQHTVQFRLRFERTGDNDGRAHLAMFYRSDSNTNEAGLFTLGLTRIRQCLRRTMSLSGHESDTPITDACCGGPVRDPKLSPGLFSAATDRLSAPRANASKDGRRRQMATSEN